MKLKIAKKTAGKAPAFARKPAPDLNRRWEEELRESERRLSLFFSQTLHGFFICMLDEPVEWHDGVDKEKALDYVMEHQRMTLANQAMLDQYGARKEDFVGITVGELFRHDLVHARRIWRGLFDRGRWRVETRERRMDGTPIVIDGDYICLYDAEGRITGHFGVQIDVTENKRTLEALEKSERRFRAVFERAKDGILIQTPEGKILDVNRAVTDMLGYTRDELLKMEIADLVPPEIAAKLSPTVRPETVAERTYIETENVRKDGTRVPIEVGSSLVEIGGEERVIAVVRDISERKKAAEKLKASEERFKNILLYAPLAIQGYRPDGTVVYWNREAERVYGYSAEEALGKDLGDLIIPGELKTVFREGLEKSAGLTRSGEFMPPDEVSLLRKDGSRVLIHSIHTAVCVGGSEPMLFSIALDLSERKRREEERLEMERNLQQTQRLESLGVLAGGIAHDFNNILTLVLGNAELALRKLGRSSPARESVTEISVAAQQAAELCKQMLAYAGRASFAWEPFDLPSLIREMEHLINISISRGVVLEYDLQPAAVEGDPSQLRQVVMNLVSNASEAIGEQSGVVTVTTGTVACSREELRRLAPEGELEPGDYAGLQVSDNGCGMDEETRQRVFEPFFTTKFTGRGLGMAAVLGIVQGHGGTISVESEPEVGTTFRILLPALGKEEAARPPEIGKGEAPG